MKLQQCTYKQKIQVGTTIEDLLSNQYVSKPRNRQIASIIKDIGWIEKYGTGIRRIRKMFQEYGSKKPDFEVVSGCFAVTVYAIDYKDNVETIQKSSEKSSEKILALLKSEPGLAAREIAERLEITPRAVEKQIANLRNDGRLRRIGPARGGRWEVLD